MNYVVWKFGEIMRKGYVFDETDIPLNEDSEIFIYEDGCVYVGTELNEGIFSLVMIGFANYDDFVDSNHPERFDEGE